MSDQTKQAPAKEYVLDPSLKFNGFWLILALLASNVLMFILTSLDVIIGSPEAKQFSAKILYWLAGDSAMFTGEFWRVLSHAWLHGTLQHLTGNMLMLAILWFTVSRYFTTVAWFSTYTIAAVISSVVYVYVNPSGHADFSNWQGAFGSYFMQPSTPLVGASGALLALFGMLVALTIRLRRLKKMAVVDVIGISPLMLAGVYAIQCWSDWTSGSAVAGLGHQIGILIGFILGMLLPMQIGKYLIANRKDVVQNLQGTRHRFSPDLAQLKFTLADTFDPTKDYIIFASATVNYRHRADMPKIELLLGGKENLPKDDKFVFLASSAGIAVGASANKTASKS